MYERAAMHILKSRIKTYGDMRRGQIQTAMAKAMKQSIEMSQYAEKIAKKEEKK